MLQNKVLIFGVHVVLTVLLGLATEGYAQLAPADRPPPPPPPPPVIRFAQSATLRPYTIRANIRSQLIPVAPQQLAGRSLARGYSRSISTHPAVSQAGFAQSRSPATPQANFAQPQRTDNTRTRVAEPQTTFQPQAGSVQPQRTVAPQAVLAQPQRTIQPQAGYVQPQTTITPQAAFAQSQRAIQPQAGNAQPQRPATPQAHVRFAQPQRTGAITTHPAQSQGYAHSQSISQPQAAFAQPQRITAAQLSFAPSLRTITRHASSLRPQSGYQQTQRIENHQG